jgi:chemotaxis protein histidine kinase CheA
MSDDFIDSIWAQFAIETEEHLEAMEQMLVAAESGNIGPEEVARLFRSFHSVKGLSKALDMIGMEALAHRAEDLLGLVRDGVALLDGPAAALLLEAVDELKALREKAVVERADGAAPVSLLERLRAAFAAAGGASGEAVEAPLPKDEAKPTGLHEDVEMLNFFMELVRDNVPALAALLDAKCAPPQSCQSCAGCDRMAAALGALGHAAETMGFTRIRDVAEDIRNKMPDEGPVSPQAREEIIALMPRFQELIRHIEQESGGDAGSVTLAQYLNATMQANFDRLFQSIVNDLDMLDAGSDDAAMDDEMVANSLFRNLAAANSFFSFLMPTSRCDLLLLLEDVYGRAARGELNIFGEIIALSRECLLMVQQVYRKTQDGKICDSAELLAKRDELAQRIRDYVWAYEAGVGSDNPVEAFRDFIKGLQINPELAEILSPENVRDLIAAVKNGEHMYEVMAHLESSEEVAAGFLTWVNKRGRVITNRSVFIDGQSWYEMLMVSSATREEVFAELEAIDPGGTMIELKTSSDQAGVGASRAGSGASPAAKPGAQAGAPSASSSVIRVAGETLDSFMNQIGEMVLVRAQLNHVINDARSREALVTLKGLMGSYYAMTGRRESDSVLSNIHEALEEQSRKLAEVDALIQSALSRLQDSAMELRVVPVEMVFKRFPRVVRDLAQAQGKRIRLDMVGQEVRIDKAMVEVLSDPLMHMVRNSADHGIELPEERKASGKNEEAQILIKAIQQGNRVIVQVIDDGRGIDPEKVRRKAVERGLVKEEESRHLSREDIYNFLFMPGFSTAEKVTETSGRGVGMDVVRTNVMRLGGSIHIQSEVGKGSTFTLEMPLSAAVQDVMLVSVAGQTLALPGRYVAEVVEIEPEEIQSIKGRRAVLLRGAFLPLAYMGDLLGFEGGRTDDARSRAAVVVSNGQQMIGIEVDRMVGRRELFVKDIHPRLAALPGVGGASILGDGKVVLILDGEALLRLAESVRQEGARSSSGAVAAEAA